MVETINHLLGIDAQVLEWWQMVLRAVVIYLLALILVQIGNRRMLGKLTLFDFILTIIFGSVVSRAINGDAPFYSTLAASLMLILLHRAFAMITFHSHRVGLFLKGGTHQLIKAGEIQWDELRRNHISIHDLETAARYEAHVENLRDVQDAYFERSGKITVIPKREHVANAEARD
jgi:uncharacterized membrane protein YcaP (DUF421 family)